jgi:hypothetical protein
LPPVPRWPLLPTAWTPAAAPQPTPAPPAPAAAGDPSTRDYPGDRLELDLQDQTPVERQLFDQILLDDPDLPGFQPALPDGFDIKTLAKQVEEEAKRKKR